MVYDRTHTRELSALQTLRLDKAIPFAAVTFAIAGAASMGLPGFSGFVAELMVLVGAWRAYPMLAIGAGVGIAVGVAYIWRAMQQAFFAGGTGTEQDHFIPAQAQPHAQEPLPAITLPERFGAMLLIAASIVVGVYPQFLLRLIDGALRGPLFAGLSMGGLR
jgi:NADH-quinone oxidoreductase subunit M